MTLQTDKVRLGYLPTYQRIAAEIGIRGKVLEVGIQEGYGLEMFQTLFPWGVVVGVDINDRATWPEGTVRIVADQSDPELPALVGEFAPFDLIVDDASHRGALTRATFDLLWPLLRRGGYYVIEDWQVAFWPGWDDTSMLHLAQSLLPMLGHPDGEVESILYRHGQAVLHKA